MPTVLDRSALEQSPLADLHLLANELGVDGFRRLRKEDLVAQRLLMQLRRRSGLIGDAAAQEAALMCCRRRMRTSVTATRRCRETADGDLSEAHARASASRRDVPGAGLGPLLPCTRVRRPTRRRQ